MTFTKPIDELVAEDIFTVCGSVTEENDYQTDVKNVLRQNRIGNIPGDSIIVLIQDLAEPIPIDQCACGHEEWWQPFQIWFFAIESDQSTLPIELRLNIARADIEKALMSPAINNGSPGFQRSGYALDTQTRRPDLLYDVTGQLIGICINIACHLRSIIGDHYSI